MQGTSMASPHAAGAAAIAAGAAARLGRRALKAALLGGADPAPALAGRGVSGARLNAAGTAASPPAAARRARPQRLRARAPCRRRSRAAGQPAARGRPRAGACAARLTRPAAAACVPRKRTATLSFQLARRRGRPLRLEAQALPRGRCRWRLAGTPHAAAPPRARALDRRPRRAAAAGARAAGA